MTELLHAWAIAPAALGACCLAADRGRARWPDALASTLMLLAMLDAVLTQVVAPVYWAALLVLTAMGTAAWRRPRRSGSRHGARPPGPMAVHTGIGLVAMAALQMGMAHEPGAATVAASHAHGGAGGDTSLAALLIGGALAYGVLSAVLVTRSHRLLDRVQLVCMGASVLLMAAAASV